MQMRSDTAVSCRHPPARLVWCALLVLLCCAASGVHGFSLSFMKDFESSYKKGDNIQVLASSVTSRSRIVPLRWGDVFTCTSAFTNSTTPQSHRNIGQVLMGDTLVNSGMKVVVLENESCLLLCSADLTAPEVVKLSKRIAGRYRAHLLLDGLPALETWTDARRNRRIRTGFSLGNFTALTDLDAAPVFNHFHFIVSYFPVMGTPSAVRIVQFEVQPRSVRHTGSIGEGNTCTLPSDPEPQLTSMRGIRYSYSVSWVESSVPWKTRWDNYVDRDPRESKVHWYSILNVFTLVLLQSAFLWFLLVRSVRRDISSYNEEDLLGDREDSGWKLVHGDVFRPPRGAVVLSVLVGNGMQLMCMVIASLIFAVAGMVSQGARGMLTTLLVMLFVFFASVNGLVTAALIKLMRRRSWQAILLTSIALPSFVFTVYLALNFIHLGTHATSTLPFSSLLYLLALWLCVSVPLCFGGAVAGFSTHITTPMKINAIPRTIPPQPWYMKGVLPSLALGVVPLAASYVELQSIFSSVWLGAIYHMFSFLMVAFVLVLVIASQMSILATYYQLNFLNYHWWWRSFFVGASYGVWLMAYCVFYYLFISIVKGFLGTVLFFGYMFLVCVGVSLIFGAAGFLASLAFVRIVYSSVKLD